MHQLTMSFFTQLWKKKGKTLNVKTKIDETAPLQNNGYDCGVFVCENVEMLTRGVTTKPNQNGMSNARKRIMKEIYLGRLISERNPSIFELARKTGNIKKRSEKTRKDKLQRPKVTVKSANEASKAGKEH